MTTCSLGAATQHSRHDAMVDHNMRGGVGVGSTWCSRAAIHSARRIEVQSAIAATPAVAEDRGAGGAANGCSAAPKRTSAASLVRRQDHHLSARRRRGWAWPERPRGVFAGLRQQPLTGYRAVRNARVKKSSQPTMTNAAMAPAVEYFFRRSAAHGFRVLEHNRF